MSQNKFVCDVLKNTKMMFYMYSICFTNSFLMGYGSLFQENDFLNIDKGSREIVEVLDQA